MHLLTTNKLELKEPSWRCLQLGSVPKTAISATDRLLTVCRAECGLLYVAECECESVTAHVDKYSKMLRINPTHNKEYLIWIIPCHAAATNMDGR